VFAARCIREAKLLTHLIPKTGTIVMLCASGIAKGLCALLFKIYWNSYMKLPPDQWSIF